MMQMSSVGDSGAGLQDLNLHGLLLGRQVKAAHNLGLPVLERCYLTGFLALQLWPMEQIETHPEGSHA